MRRIAEKIATLVEARARMAEWKEAGIPVALVTGAFDPLEAADARELASRRPPGGRLIVAVEGDRSVRATLGSGRPVVSAEDRACVVAALATVDLVVSPGDDESAAAALGLEAARIGAGRAADLVARIRARLAGRP